MTFALVFLYFLLFLSKTAFIFLYGVKFHKSSEIERYLNNVKGMKCFILPKLTPINKTFSWMGLPVAEHMRQILQYCYPAMPQRLTVSRDVRKKPFPFSHY